METSEIIFDTTATDSVSTAVGTGVLAGLGIMLFVYLVILILLIIAQWKIFTKAGKPGWASIIPIYNAFVLLEIVGKPTWWIILLLIPFVNIVIAIILAIELGKVFGKSTGWSVVMLVFLSLIGYLVLAFSDAKYTKPVGEASSPAPTPATG